MAVKARAASGRCEPRGLGDGDRRPRGGSSLAVIGDIRRRGSARGVGLARALIGVTTVDPELALVSNNRLAAPISEWVAERGSRGHAAGGVRMDKDAAAIANQLIAMPSLVALIGRPRVSSGWMRRWCGGCVGSRSRRTANRPLQGEWLDGPGIRNQNSLEPPPRHMTLAPRANGPMMRARAASQKSRTTSWHRGCFATSGALRR